MEFFDCKKCGLTYQALIEFWYTNADKPHQIKMVHLADADDDNEEMRQVITTIKLGTKSALMVEHFIYCFDCHQPMQRCNPMNQIKKKFEKEVLIG